MFDVQSCLFIKDKEMVYFLKLYLYIFCIMVTLIKIVSFKLINYLITLYLKQ